MVVSGMGVGGWVQVTKAGESADIKAGVCHAVWEQKKQGAANKAGCNHRYSIVGIIVL